MFVIVVAVIVVAAVFVLAETVTAVVIVVAVLLAVIVIMIVVPLFFGFLENGLFRGSTPAKRSLDAKPIRSIRSCFMAS